MKTIKKLSISLLTILSFGLLFSYEVKATMVVIDFNNAVIGALFTNDYFEDGFRMQCITGHYDIWKYDGGGTDNTPYLGLDTLDYFGYSQVRFTRIDGGNFNLISFDTFYLSDYEESLSVKSSNGGDMYINVSGVQLFSGPEWSNLSSIDFYSYENIALPGIDSITITVIPVTASLWLLCSSLMGFVMLRRKLTKA